MHLIGVGAKSGKFTVTQSYVSTFKSRSAVVKMILRQVFDLRISQKVVDFSTSD